jgi:transposase InsO family protein
MTRELVISALRMAWFRRKPATGLIHHSDRGSQYASHDYQAVLKEYGMTASMSRKGNCWENEFQCRPSARIISVTRPEKKQGRTPLNTSKCFTIGVVATPRWGTRVRQRSTLPGSTNKNWRLNSLRLVLEKQG